MPMPQNLILVCAALLGCEGFAVAQQSWPRGPLHNPVSLVDTVDRLAAFGPPGNGVVTPLDGPSNYTLGTNSLSLGTGWIENYDWVEPIPAPTQLVPLLVVFHKFGTSQKDMIVNTDFAGEAGRRGWYAVCPLAANTKNFAAPVSQIHMQAVIQDMLLRFPLIDPNRIYGVGFSMGAGGATNYAARHLDPSKPMLAAMVSMSGGYALNDTYFNDPPTRPILDFWYGNGTVGSADPFKLTNASVIRFDPYTSVVVPNQDLARNLSYLPLQVLRAYDEGVPYVPRQSDVLVSHLSTLGIVPGPTFDSQIVPFGLEVYDHRWQMLDETWACNWLGQFTLTIPTAGNTMADRDDVYFHFYVEQDVPNAFTPFNWTLDTPNNTLRLAATANLKRLTVDTLAAGFNPTLDIIVNVSTADGFGDEIVFTQVLQAPSNVTRDGSVTGSWSYNALAHELTLIETDGMIHDWAIVP